MATAPEPPDGEAGDGDQEVEGRQIHLAARGGQRKVFLRSSRRLNGLRELSEAEVVEEVQGGLGLWDSQAAALLGAVSSVLQLKTS